MAGQQQQRNNSGILFRNNQKQSDNHPDYKGEALINGGQFWMAAWIKEGAKGKFMTFSFTPKEQQAGQQSQATRSKPIVNDEFQDDYPF